jgi:hypothetical protein
LAARQFNRVARGQLAELGLWPSTIADWVERGRLVRVHEGVFAIGAVLEDDDWGRWMAATLTAPGSVLSHASAAAAYGFWSLPRHREFITRPGSGGPRRQDGLLVFRSLTLEGECQELRGVPITSVGRTLLDLASFTSPKALARAVREAVRLKLITLEVIAEVVGRYRGRRGSRKLASAIARYAGLPLERARSGAEVRALEVLRDAGRTLPRLNVRVAGEEADLSWPSERLIIEIDGDPFHLDKGEDARKQAVWEAAVWTVRRLSSDDVYDHPERLLSLAPQPERP